MFWIISNMIIEPKSKLKTIAYWLVLRYCSASLSIIYFGIYWSSSILIKCSRPVVTFFHVWPSSFHIYSFIIYNHYRCIRSHNYILSVCHDMTDSRTQKELLGAIFNNHIKMVGQPKLGDHIHTNRLLGERKFVLQMWYGVCWVENPPFMV